MLINVLNIVPDQLALGKVVLSPGNIMKIQLKVRVVGQGTRALWMWVDWREGQLSAHDSIH